MAAQQPPAQGSPDAEAYYDLGSFHREVTTENREAQTWFDRGLVWSYGFNHEEAVACFERAIALDANFAMAYWGLAYALGPNYNKPWEFFEGRELETTVERTHRAVRRAVENSLAVSPVERALISALQLRYPSDQVPSANCPTDDGKGDTDWPIWNQNYARAMNFVYGDFPNDLDVAAIYVDALMNLTPWKLWDIRTGQPAPGASTLEAKAVLERALAQDGGDRHPGLLHLYIHLMEMSSTPEAALTMADNLRGLVPDSGHLNHMPSHLDILCGEYRAAVQANSAAIRVDEKFLAREGPMNFYTLYRSHDYHFRIYAAMFSGQYKAALETVELLEKSVPEELLREESPPMGDWLEGFMAMRVHIYIRFGRWKDIIKMSFPEDQKLYCTTTAMVTYAKGVAHAAVGEVNAAEACRTSFRELVKLVPESRTLFNNTCVDILGVAGAMLDGEVEYRRGNIDIAFEHLRKAIELYDALPYDEPWGWMQPVRHAYGALLLEQGRVEEAAAVYRADLGFDDTLPRANQHPNNVWALHGYHECLVKLGRAAEAGIVVQSLKQALAVADVPIKSSCFCRTSVTESCH